LSRIPASLDIIPHPPYLSFHRSGANCFTLAHSAGSGTTFKRRYEPDRLHLDPYLLLWLQLLWLPLLLLWPRAGGLGERVETVR
jgi:hypothetical protein